MLAMDDLLKDVPLPRMVKAVQNFERPVLEDVGGELTRKLREGNYLASLKPGMSVAVTAGSRGISNIPLMIKTVVSEVRALGGNPFVFPAMGSHGGATAEGQRSMLEGLGITEESVGAPIRATMETVQLGVAANGRPAYLDRYADAADAIIVVNRIKPHTGFRGEYESGLCKMCVIGMGKQKGAAFCHAEGFEHMAENIPAIAAVTLAKKNVLCAVGIIENAWHETAQIEVMRGDEVLEKEPPLLRRAWALMPKILLDEFDVLVLDEIGKNISGTGFDTNIVGRYNTPFAFGGPKITRVLALDITDASHGNGNGLGMLDMTTIRAYEKFSMDQTYPNGITSTVPLTVKIPMVLKNDRQAIQAAVRTCNVDPAKVRMVRIKNTLSLSEIEISESLVPEANQCTGIEVTGVPFDWPFNADGNLF